MAPIGFFKNIKELGKKIARKAGGAINKVGKTIKDIKNKLPIDKIAKYIPYGEVINDVADIALDVAEHGGNALENIGNGRNVVNETFNAARNILSNETTNQYAQKGLNYIERGFKDAKDRLQNNNAIFSQNRPLKSGIQDENVYRPNNNSSYSNTPKKRPKFLDNLLN